MDRFEFDHTLTLDTKLYRYVSLETFLSFIESGRTSLANIASWDDNWEAILSKVPLLDDNGERIFPLYSSYQGILGQCWSLLPESDAMWRIYSPHETGILYSTSVKRFELLQGPQKFFLGRVAYFEDVQDLLTKAEQIQGTFSDACLKRSSFRHEEEVRLLTHCDFIPDCGLDHKYVTLELDPLAFLEGITIDPRAADWFVETVKRYCHRAGFAIEPTKSDLYNPDPHLKLGVFRRYVPVEGTEGKNEKESGSDQDT